MNVGDIMTREPLTVSGDTPIHTLAQIMVERGIGTLPVVDTNGRILGMVRKIDLIVQEAQLRFPRYLQFLDSIIFLEPTGRFDEQLRKELATTAAEIMTTRWHRIAPGADVSQAANRMLEEEVTALAVLEGEKLVGIVTRTDLVRLLIGTAPPAS